MSLGGYIYSITMYHHTESVYMVDTEVVGVCRGVTAF